MMVRTIMSLPKGDNLSKKTSKNFSVISQKPLKNSVK